MPYNDETRRLGRRASEGLSFGRDTSEVADSLEVFNQIAWLTAHYDVGVAHARVIAENAFARRAPR